MREFRLDAGQLLKQLKPLYGLSDSGDYWHMTFSSHFMDDLKMVPTAGGLIYPFQASKWKFEWDDLRLCR